MSRNKRRKHQEELDEAYAWKLAEELNPTSGSQMKEGKEVQSELIAKRISQLEEAEAFFKEQVAFRRVTRSKTAGNCPIKPVFCNKQAEEQTAGEWRWRFLSKKA